MRIVFHGFVSCTDWDGDLTTNGGVHPGCSGGPVLNQENQVIGIVSRSPILGYGSVNTTVCIGVPTSVIREALSAAGIE